MKIVTKTEPQSEIHVRDIVGGEHIVVGIGKHLKEPVFLTRDRSDWHYYGVILNNSGLTGNKYNNGGEKIIIDDFINAQDNIEWAAFTDWKDALRWLIDNGK